MSYQLINQPSNYYVVDADNEFIWLIDTVSRDSILKTLDSIRNNIKSIALSAGCCDIDVGLPLYYLPFYLIERSRYFSIDDCPTDVETDNCFNFMINKKMIHRYLVMRLIKVFDLSSFDYTYSGSCTNINDDIIFQDLDIVDPNQEKFSKGFIAKLLGENKIPSKFLGVENYSDLVEHYSRIPMTGETTQAWKGGLDKIFSRSLISIVTESDVGNYDKSSSFSEKTIYALLGLTIPIWPGGYKHAENLSCMGFDVFDDIIDHGYQHESTVFMRCYRAIKDNLHLLDDLESAKKLREQLMPRLLNNRNHLFSEELLTWYRSGIESWPLPIKQFVTNQFPWLNP